MAECHPVGFQWVMEAKAKGAKIIHVDPRFTRTSAMADLHVPIRTGTDIALLGALIKYVIDNERYFKEYIVSYSNAAALVDDKYQDTEDLDGLFAGWQADKGEYDVEHWQYKGAEQEADGAQRHSYTGQADSERGSQTKAKHFDYTLQDPLCVFQILKRHFSRYTPEMVQDVCGITPELFLKVAKALCDNSGRERTSAFCYAVGWTHHSVGAQYIRTASILQTLLGNIGRPGGGILALRGHATIQGSTDIPTLFNLLPGYMPMPKAGPDPNLGEFLEHNTGKAGWWTEFPKYFVSMMKAWYGDAATKANDFCFEYLPRIAGDHSHMTTVVNMADGDVQGYFVMGENPVVGSPNAGLQRKGMRALEWCVVRDFAPTETAEFWKYSPEHERGELKAEDIATEVFFFPAATHTEKDGSFTQTQRLAQWHHAAIEPPGDTRSELHFIYHLGKRLRKLYAASTDPKDRALTDLTWEYPVHGRIEEPSAEAVLAEINGYTFSDRKPIGTYYDLKDDGSTACGCWIYCGIAKDGVNMAARRKPGNQQNWLALEWGYSWPANRRILYNRAAADPEGKPWSDRKALVWWDEAQKKWTGHDVPDFILDRDPSYRAPDEAKGTDTISGDDPFIMQADGKAWLFAPHGLQDGPLPTHYEPMESVIQNPLYGQQCNPARLEYNRRDNRAHRPFDDPRFPYVLTTYRLTEHHTAGSMSRWLSWLNELQPEMFCEVSKELAAEKGLENGGWATIRTGRGEIEARVLVTGRLTPLRVKGRYIHQIGIPYHWGAKGRVQGDSANELLAFSADANTSIMESKALTADIEPGRRARGPARVGATSVMDEFGDTPGEELRDLPPARNRPEGKHHVKAGQNKQGDQT